MALRSYKQEKFCGTNVEKQRNEILGPEVLDTRWSSETTPMGGEHELEEGEACDDLDSSCDPDTAFAYLDEKVSMVLGDVQKYFEGGVSAEKLGSKFGGYGSFLPTQERTLSFLHHDKPANAIASDAYCRTKKSSNERIVEKIRRTAAGSSAIVTNSKAGSSSANVLRENGDRDVRSANEGLCNVDTSLPAVKVEENVGQPKKVTLRIRMGSDTHEIKNKSSIYSHFGLSNSSSATNDEDDADDYHGSDSGLDSSSDQSPLTMIRLMTSLRIPDGMLLSPLPDLLAEPFLQKDRLWLANRDNISEKATTSVSKGSTRHGIKDDGDQTEISKEKLRECARNGRKIDGNSSSERVGKKAKHEKGIEGGSKESSKKPPSKAYGKDALKLNNEITAVDRQSRDAVSESGTGLRSVDSHTELKGSIVDKAPSEYPFFDAEHVPHDFCSPFQPSKEVDHPARDPLSRGYNIEKATCSSSHDSMNGHLDMGREQDVKKRKTAKEFVVPSDTIAYGSQDVTKKSLLKSSGGGKFVELTSDVPSTIGRELTQDLPESRKKSKGSIKEGDIPRGSTKERGKDSYKEPRNNSYGKERHGVVDLPRNLSTVHEALREGNLQSLKTSMRKDLRQGDPLPKAHKAETTELHKKKEKSSKERIKSDYSSKDASRLSERDGQKESASRDSYTKLPLHMAGVPEAMSSDKPSNPTEALPPQVTGNAVAAQPYVIIHEEWVLCDKCEKWRLLPPGVNEGHLPQKWRCKMLDWLVGMNSCNIPEEVTTQHTMLLYNGAAAPPPQENLPAIEQIQPPPPPPPQLPPPPPPPLTTPPLPLANANPTQETRVPEKAKANSSKKRKMPPTTSTEAVQSKSKRVSDPGQGLHELSQANKFDDGETKASHQEKIQAKVGGIDASVEEKRKPKEREKAKRFRHSDGASPLGKEHSQTPANQVLREAIKMKHSANRLQGKVGMKREGTALYLQAALKFLQAASMLECESSEYGDNRHGDGMQSLQIYTDTAILCEYCALMFEHSKDLASAALAYKCAGFARMRVVQAKSLSICKDRAELQSVHHQPAPCESPNSSTALGVHTDTNTAADKVPARGVVSPALNPQKGGSFIIAAKNRPRFNRVLQYVADTNAAMDALSKSHSSFTAAKVATIYSPESMMTLERVLDFGFHDVESLVQLVRVALEAMEQQQRL